MLQNRVREFRELHGLTQDELADRCGLSPRLIHALESQPGYSPTMRVALKLCIFFHAEIGRLFWIDWESSGAADDEPESSAA